MLIRMKLYFCEVLCIYGFIVGTLLGNLLGNVMTIATLNPKIFIPAIVVKLFEQ